MNNKNIKAFVISCILLIIFGVFSRSVSKGVWNVTDFAVTVKLQEKIDTSSHLKLADFVGNIMEGSSFFAGPEFSLIFLFVLTGLYCFDGKKKAFNVRGLMIPLLFGLLVIGELYGKSVIHHPSPPFYMIKNATTIFPKYYINEQFSYPSGHAARAVFLSLSLYSFVLYRTNIFKKRKNMLIGIILASMYIAIVLLSRIYLGHHWFSDIAGGALLGSALWFFTQVVAVY